MSSGDNIMPVGKEPVAPDSPNRFQEDGATYAVRGSELPDIDRGIGVIQSMVKTLSSSPGVYRMLDARGDVLYVGKARALKHRVSSYTQRGRLPGRLMRIDRQHSQRSRGSADGSSAYQTVSAAL